MNAGSPRRRGVVAVVPSDGRLLVIRRSRFVVAPRTYCFPGGAIHESEVQQAALAREMQEELAVRAVGRRKLWSSVTPWNVELAWWLAEILPNQAVQPNPAEVESFAWMTPKEIRALPDLLESNHHFFDAWDRNEFDLKL